MKRGHLEQEKRKMKQNGAYKMHGAKWQYGTVIKNGVHLKKSLRKSSLKRVSLSLKSNNCGNLRLHGQTPLVKSSVQSGRSSNQLPLRRTATKKNGVAPAPTFSVGSGEIDAYSDFKIENGNRHAIQNVVDAKFDSVKISVQDSHAWVLGTAVAIVLPISLAAVVIGLATPFWIRKDYSDIGLFQSCESWHSQCTLISSSLISTSQFSKYKEHRKVYILLVSLHG